MGKTPKVKRFRVYLAGPIHGCNEAQRSHWRRRVRDKWGDRFEFVDPNDAIVAVQTTAEAGYEIIRRDQQAIRSCDAVLANMWRESVGTAIGIVHAKREGKLVAIVDPNHIGNRILAFYADVMSEKADDALRQIKALLEQQGAIRTVIKRQGRPDEDFSRETLAASIRKACHTAGKDDLIVPAKVVPLVIERLLEGGQAVSGRVTTSAIKEAVWDVLALLEADPLRGEEFAGIRRAWESYNRKAKMSPLERDLASVGKAVPLSPAPLQVLVEAGKAHTTIWGVHVQKLEDIPQPVRGIFQEITCVPGIRRIHFGPFDWGHTEDRCRVELFASKTSGIIEGKCYDQGKKGNVQSFQLEVLDPGQAEAIRQALIRHLRGLSLLRIRE